MNYDYDQVVTDLEEKGYAILPGVLDEKECETAINDIWKWLEGLGTGIKRGDKKTWASKNWPPNIHGIIQHLRIGHTEFAWKVRANPNVYKAYSKIWGTKKLLASYDGVCVMKPPEITRRWNKQRKWYHTDQTLRDSRKKCIQGFVTLENMSSDDGTLCVLAGSHKYHNTFAKWRKSESDEVAPSANWYKLNSQETNWYLEQKGVKEVKVSAPKGALVLWDSRTIHQNKWPDKGRKHPRWRYVVYSCMLPAENAPVKDLRKRTKALSELRMTTHWPYPCTLFPEKPRTYGKEMPEWKTVTTLPDLSPLARKLAGIDEWEATSEKSSDSE